MAAESVPLTDPTLALCPNSGGICPAREVLVALYTEHADDAMVSETERHADGIKLAAKLAENALRARFVQCPGANETCPVRDTMDASKPRQVAVSGIRKLIRRGN